MKDGEKTRQMEINLFKTLNKPNSVFICPEVTIGWFGKERVDFLSYDVKHIFRCYEIKVSKSDFRSKCHNTFVGHYNYYVMPKELFKKVKDEIPGHIGVYVDGLFCVKNPKKQELTVDSKKIYASMIRSLYREASVKLCNRYLKGGY